MSDSQLPTIAGKTFEAPKQTGEHGAGKMIEQTRTLR